LPSINLDFDWFYRRLGVRVANSSINFLANLRSTLATFTIGMLTRISRRIYRHHGPQGVLARTWPTGSMVIWVAILLASYLILYYT
jgi:multicomponent Na+:H+ antiporter subunit D